MTLSLSHSLTESGFDFSNFREHYHYNHYNHYNDYNYYSDYNHYRDSDSDLDLERYSELVT